MIARRPSARVVSGRQRVVIEGITPLVDGGRYPIKRVVGEVVVVEADCFADGHDVLSCMLQYRHAEDGKWSEVAMRELGNDRWIASFAVERIGEWRYCVTAWVDQLQSWAHDFERRVDPEDLLVAAKSGADLIAGAAARAPTKEERKNLETWARSLREASADQVKQIAHDDALLALAVRYAARTGAVRTSLDLRIIVDRERARFSTWYEMFPRSASDTSGTHGTFDDVRKRLDYVSGMGFDVLYLPPIHPIGRIRRKGKNNAVTGTPEDPGSPWAIGAEEGGHKDVLAALGTLDDFKSLVEDARAHRIEIALDIAFQCAPDHPYVAAHPQWFRWRPDGTVQYAENPPKKYQDIYPLNFESDDWSALWDELRSVFEFWIEAGVRIFRVDNPHTKPFRFWEWVIAEIKREFPDALFLAEAFTRPKVMHRLAKLGFTQCYTYFTWRNTKEELIEYFTELAQDPSREYFRPNCWPNTPDILAVSLRNAGAPAFRLRLLLAATLAANYGIYGPAFELLENAPRDDVSEEYLNSEKYEIRHWDLSRPDSLAPFISSVNAIRHANAALQSDWSLIFHTVDNSELLCYSKRVADNCIVVVANLDTRYAQSGWVTLDLDALDLASGTPYEMHDLLSGARYQWHGMRNFVRLDPALTPAHIFRVLGEPRPAAATSLTV